MFDPELSLKVSTEQDGRGGKERDRMAEREREVETETEKTDLKLNSKRWDEV